MKKYSLSKQDIEKSFFHFTKEKNLNSIEKNGLLPKISFHAQSLEDTKKVFFVEGLDNLLILFDCWINVVSVYPLIPGMFNIGTKIKGTNKFSKNVIKIYFKWMKFNKIHKLIAYKYFDMFLKKYILLNINIKEGIDFDYDDYDQIKARGYDKDFLIKAGYSLKYSDLDSNKMDKWNMHTFSNHGINSEKIKICYIEKSYKMKDILKFATDNTKLDLQIMWPVLWSYMKKRKLV